MEANKALQDLDHEALRKVAELGNFSFYALLDVQNRSLKINTENTQRILQAVAEYRKLENGNENENQRDQTTG